MKLTLRMIQKEMNNEVVAELIELTQEEIEQLRRQQNNPWLLNIISKLRVSF